MSAKDSNRKNEFRRQAQRAELVLLVLSETYMQSRASQQQACYCLLRKKVGLVVSCTDKEVPVSLQKRLQFASLVVKYESDSWESRLLEQMKKVLKQPEKRVFETLTEDTTFLEARLRTQLPGADFKVYVTGGTRVTSKRSESICCAIGQELALLKFVSLCTCGFYGVEELGGQELQRGALPHRERPAPRVFHVVPERDKKDWSKKAYQRPDGTFGGIPHGQVKIVGSSMAERDSVIARVFQVCILVEGDECTARRVGEFVWNDKPVIPVFCTGKAAAGEHNSSTGVDSTTLRSICENPPPGVDCNTWFLLKNSSSSPEDIGKAVRKIVTNVYRQTKKRPTELPEVLKKVSRPG
uniref:TIR domain-containing protein n=1 Tax=Ixodes ricinus TaxID=34613 RepID=V5HEH4_IXORI